MQVSDKWMARVSSHHPAVDRGRCSHLGNCLYLHAVVLAAESCCGSPTCLQADEDLRACESSQRWEDSRMFQSHDSSVAGRHACQHQLDETSACRPGSDDSGCADFTQGDDFEVLEPSMLLDDPCFDTYPGMGRWLRRGT